MEHLLRQWRTLYDERQHATAPIRQELDILNAALEEIEAPFNENMALLETEIRQHTLANMCGMKVKALGVEITYRRGYDRTSWDAKALDGFAAAHPEILPFRSTTHVQASVSVKAL